MTGEVIPWPANIPESGLNIKFRVEGVIAIFRAIDAGELLAALPECDLARTHHNTALALLSMAERELLVLRDVLERIA